MVLLERNKAVQEVGAGLQISPNARRVLNQLGLDRQIAAKSFEPAGIDLYPFRSRKPVTTLTLGALAQARFGVPYAVMHRADLAEVLYRACRRFASIDMVFGVRAFDAVSHARGVSVTVEEADGRSRNGRGFAFVGADGANSVTRTQILDGPPADYQNRIAWRTLLDLNALDGAVALDRTSLLFGPGYHAVCYPLPHRGKLNIALFAREPKERAYGAAAPREPSLPLGRHAQRPLRRHPCGGARTMGLLAAGDGFRRRLAQGRHRPHRGCGPRHAAVPGAGRRHGHRGRGDPCPAADDRTAAEQAFARFVSLRRARVDQVAGVAAANGFAFHLEWPFSRARDAVLRLQGGEGHLKRLAWLYGYDAAPDAELKAPPRPAVPNRPEREHRH